MANYSHKLKENVGDVKEPAEYLTKNALSVDWIAGIIPETDVADVLAELDKLTAGRLASHTWAVAQGGFFNYKVRLCWQGRFHICLCFNEAAPGTGRSEEFAQLLPELDRRKAIRAALRASEAAEADFEGYTMRQVTGGTRRISTRAQDEGNNPYMYLVITGTGCAQLRELGKLDKLLFWLGEHGFRASRLDIACDIYDRDNPVVPLLERAFRGAFAPEKGGYCLKAPTTPTKCIQLVQVGEPETGLTTNCVYGNHGSNSGMFRAYNKHHEQRYKSGRLSDERLRWLQAHPYWFRLEYEAHSEFAAQCFQLLVDSVLSLSLTFVAMAERLFTPVFVDSGAKQHCMLALPHVWDAFLRYLTEQNDYFVSFCEEEPGKRKKALASYGQWCKNMRKTFVGLLFQLVADSDFDPEGFVRSGADKLDGDSWFSDVVGLCPPQLINDFLRWAADYKQRYGDKLRNNALA